MVTEPRRSGQFGETAHAKLVKTRNAVVANPMKIADWPDQQGEVALAGDVRYFAKRLPPIRTDMETLAVHFAQHLAASRRPATNVTHPAAKLVPDNKSCYSLLCYTTSATSEKAHLVSFFRFLILDRG
jgi:hypothetical protein